MIISPPWDHMCSLSCLGIISEWTLWDAFDLWCNIWATNFLPRVRGYVTIVTSMYVVHGGVRISNYKWMSSLICIFIYSVVVTMVSGILSWSQWQMDVRDCTNKLGSQYVKSGWVLATCKWGCPTEQLRYYVKPNRHPSCVSFMKIACSRTSWYSVLLSVYVTSMSSLSTRGMR